MVIHTGKRYKSQMGLMFISSL